MVIVPADPHIAHFTRLLFPITSFVMGWAIAVPIITALISAYSSKKGQKDAQQGAMSWANAKTRFAMQQLSDEGISRSADTYFPGLLPKTRSHWVGPMQTGTPSGMTVTTRSGAPRTATNPTGSEVIGTSSGPSDLWGGPNETLSGGAGEGGTTPLPAGLKSQVVQRATGGPVAAGQPTIVGEKGPELMVPQTAGTVVPNSGIPSVAGGAGAAAANTPTVPGNMQQAPQGPQEPGKNLSVGTGPEGITSPTPAPGTQPSGPTEGAQGGATVSDVSLPQDTSAGALITQHLMNTLKNPGQISPAAYEREQENANQGLNFANRAIGGTLSASGIDPNSGYGQMLGQSAALNAMKLRNEANRDFTIASEQMRRSDIQTATNTYINFLQTLFGLGAARANTAVGASANVAPTFPNMNEGVAQGVGMAGQTLGSYFASRQPATPPASNSASVGGGSTASGVGPGAHP